jgi:hypothetical protein
MTDTDLHQPDPGPLRAAAEAAELAQAVTGLVSIDGCRLTDSDPLAPLARDIARSLTEAGLTVHHCAQHDPLYRLGGVCVLAVPFTESARPGPAWFGSVCDLGYPCPAMRAEPLRTYLNPPFSCGARPPELPGTREGRLPPSRPLMNPSAVPV